MKKRIPTSTYRVQFNREFRFSDALKIVDYLKEFGISDLYASPILKAREGSTHGYDVTDPAQINPELGTAEDFDRLSRKLQKAGMGLLLDIVPNHMAASLENPWWFDVLEKGSRSNYARFFDVDWDSEKVLLPILGRPYREAIERNEIELKVVNGRSVIQYFDQSLPVAQARTPRSASLDDVLERQHYRLAFWRKASDSINYRRFFDISDLIGICAEKEEVYEATHTLVLRLLKEKKVTGLRIDHIDGLLDPKSYLDRLPASYVTVEKILAGNERLPEDWRCDGTTGYDFLNILNGPFIDPAGFRRLENIYAEFTGISARGTEVFRQRKLQVMKELFSGEVSAFVRSLSQLAKEDREAREIPQAELKRAFEDVIAALPVYRTYIRDLNISERDRAIIEDALTLAGKGRAVSFLRRVLLLEPAWYLKMSGASAGPTGRSDQEKSRPAYLSFVMRWQQFTGPVMAKGLEDTTFYVHNPLVSVNEVGGDPEPANLGVEEFHRRNLMRRAEWPASLNASSTHDTKRSEDVRARIDVLSEIPEDWGNFLKRVRRKNPSNSAPDRNEQVLIYQNLLGAWPIDAGRLKQYVTKALREGKTNSHWLNVNEDYERRVMTFIDSLYASKAFLRDVAGLHLKLGWFGALNSLSQLLLKVASPGVPDFYRGTEVWDFSLADPDNRRPVDYEARMRIFNQLKTGSSPQRLLKCWEDGRVKMFVAWKSLNFRRANPDLFEKGDYIPLQVTGPRRNHVVAFARRHGGNWVIVAAPRLMAQVTEPGVAPVGKKFWQDTAIELPAKSPATWSNILTKDQPPKGLGSTLKAASLFATFPFAFVIHTAA